MARNYTQGFFKPIFPQKYKGDVNQIVFRSSWERKVMHWCDRNPSVVQWTSEELKIPYFSRADNKMRRYYIDFVVQLRNSDNILETVMIEIKPYKETIEPVKGRKKDKTYLQEVYTWMVNSDKWKAATEFGEQNNMKFLILTEYDIGIKKRV